MIDSAIGTMLTFASVALFAVAALHKLGDPTCCAAAPGLRAISPHILFMSPARRRPPDKKTR